MSGVGGVDCRAMRRFGSVFPFVEQGARPRTIGRLVANHDFVRALLAHATYDDYLFSNPSASNLRTFASMARECALLSSSFMVRRKAVRHSVTATVKVM